jgi:hypothetical protein
MSSKVYLEDTSIAGRRAEIDIKVGRIIRMLETEGLEALYLARQANFAWITAGGNGVVTMCTEDSVATILITRDGRRFAFADVVEALRMKEEQHLEELGFEILSQQWYENRREEYITKIAGSLDKVGADVQYGSMKLIQNKINPLRWSLTENEICRYQYLGDYMSEALEKYIATVKPGMTEFEIAGGVAGALWPKQIDQVLFLVASDDRIKKHRHPIPTDKKLEKCLMVSCNGRYKGFITTTTRMVYFGKAPAELLHWYDIASEIENRMIEATKPGVDDLIPHMVGKQAYKDLGCEEMYYSHYQGGPQGYYNREYSTSESCHNITQVNQCYCYNPVTPGAKSEDAFIATPEGPLMITKPKSFPKIIKTVNGVRFERPGMLVID